MKTPNFEEAVAMVSYWAIPGGSDYTNAYVKEVFFTEMAEAQSFATRFSNPPEMAILLPLHKCRNCGLKVFERANGQFNDRKRPTLNQYCWVDEIHGSQLHEV